MVVEAKEAVSETIAADDLQTELLRGADPPDRRIGPSAERLLIARPASEPELPNVQEIEPQGALEPRVELEAGGGKGRPELLPEGGEGDAALAAPADFSDGR